MTRLDPKTKKNLTKVQKDMNKVCNDLKTNCVRAAATLIFTRNSYFKMMEHEDVKDNETYIEKIKSIISDIDVEIRDINEVVKIVHETMEFIPTKKKDSKLIKKVQDLISSDQMEKFNKENSGDKLTAVLNKLTETKKEFGIEEKAPVVEESVGKIVEETVEETTQNG